MQLRKLEIRRYRGIDTLTWCPNPTFNCLAGPGDSGKSSVLTAIATLLAPYPLTSPSEYDYFRREIENGFEIEGLLGSIDEVTLASLRVPPLWGWKDQELLPLTEGEGVDHVLRVRVSGTPDFEIKHELIPSSGDPVPFSVGFRRRLFMAKLTGDEWTDRELRMGKGSLLERHLGSSPDLKKALNEAVKDASGAFKTPASTEEALEKLREVFRGASLPSELLLGFQPPRGSNLLGMLGLYLGSVGSASIPLSLSGTGTKQLALFNLTLAFAGASPVLLLDEPELGLEPYRQRWLISRLRELVGDKGQAFITTHSPFVLQELVGSELWRLTDQEGPTPLSGAEIDDILKVKPEALLSRLPVICEGVTEVGVLKSLLTKRAQDAGEQSLDARGLVFASGGSNERAVRKGLRLCEAGISCGVFVDCEDDGSGLRKSLSEKPRCAYHEWKGVRNIEEAISKWLPFEKLVDLLQFAASLKGVRETSLLQQVGERIGSPGRATLDELKAGHNEEEIRGAIAEAMLDNSWFKTEDRGWDLGEWLLKNGIPPQIGEQIGAFWDLINAKLK